MTREEELDAVLTEHAKLTAWFNEQKWSGREQAGEWRQKLRELEEVSAEIRRLSEGPELASRWDEYAQGVVGKTWWRRLLTFLRRG